jgi:RND superfamily putative drug exporter
MAEFLYRLGKFSARRAWAVLVAWIVILGLALTAFLLSGGQLANGFDIPGTETAKVNAQLEQAMLELAGGSGAVVFRTTNGSPFSDEQREQIGDLVASAEDLEGVDTVVDPFATEAQRDAQEKQLPEAHAQLDAARAQLDQAEQFGMMAPAELEAARAELDAQAEQLLLARELLDLAAGIRTVSADDSTALVNVLFTVPRLELPDEVKVAVMDHFTESPIDGVEVEFSAEIAATVPQIVGPGELAGLAIAAIVLIVMLGTLIGAGLPILNALIGVGIGVLSALSFSAVVPMASVTPVLGVMLGLAVGIDYTLFIVNRHRVQLRQGLELRESIGLANGTAGNSVVFAGSTVLVALLALNVTGIPFLGLMGTVGAVCILVAVLIAVTLTPAMLRLIGRRVLSARQRAALTGSPKAASPAKPVSTLRAVLTVLLTSALLLVIALPALSLRLGLPDGTAEAVDSTQHRAYQLTAEAFGEGVNGPLLVIATVDEPIAEGDLLATQAEVARVISETDGVVAVAPIGTSDDQQLLAFQVRPAEGPSSISTEQLVTELRGLSPLRSDTGGGDIVLGVAGQSTGNIDISQKLAEALPLYLGVVIGLSLLILIVVFRSLLVPLVATAGFILSLFATYGALVAVYQWGWFSSIFGVHDPAPILNFLPIVLVGILFGLAMDYQLFITSGMREAYVHGTPARAAVTAGVRAGRSVVTAAAIIMIAVFSGFIFSDAAIIRPLGFGLAFGILVDAFLVRMLLVPAAMHLLGRSAWWLPKWLDRILPDVDIEGAALERRHETRPGVPADAPS